MLPHLVAPVIRPGTPHPPRLSLSLCYQSLPTLAWSALQSEAMMTDRGPSQPRMLPFHP